MFILSVGDVNIDLGFIQNIPITISLFQKLLNN